LATFHWWRRYGRAVGLLAAGVILVGAYAQLAVTVLLGCPLAPTFRRHCEGHDPS